VLDLKFWSVLANPRSAAWAAAWAWVGEGEQDGRSWACQAVEAVAEELRAAGLAPTPLVEEGDPKRVLVEEAERWAADCIFVGAKGHGALERILIGSVSAAVAARAHCSVEVVRQG
jgi:nucleotide-binding universal stress UspA family protein